MEQTIIDQLLCFLVISIVTAFDSWSSLPALHGINNKNKWIYLPLVCFGIASGLIGLLFYHLCVLSNDINKAPIPIRGVMISLLYLSLVNQKFGTIKPEKEGDKQTELGIIALYSFLKNISHKFINNIHLKHLTCKELIDTNGREKDDTKSLKNAAIIRAMNDIFKNSKEKSEDIAWIEATTSERGNSFKKNKYLQKYIDTGIRFELITSEKSVKNSSERQ
ncbi:hypothetical protein [Pseudanabaena minima]|uniref:hypothetical protein n=1 Tax=Pseudanabaena minima TaxID=890415 RepID=UPI003DA855E4